MLLKRPIVELMDVWFPRCMNELQIMCVSLLHTLLAIRLQLLVAYLKPISAVKQRLTSQLSH